MSISPLGRAAPAVDAPDRHRGLAAVAILLACLASISGGAWSWVSLTVALTLRPSRLSQARLSDEEWQAVVAPARNQLWLFTLVYLSALLLFSGAAILLGRRALRGRASEYLLALLGMWALWLLVGSLLLGLYPFLLQLHSPASDWLVSLALAAAIGSAIFAGVAVSRPEVTMLSPGTGSVHRAWRVIPRVCLVVATLICVAVYSLYALIAQIIVGFYGRLVF